VTSNMLRLGGQAIERLAFERPAVGKAMWIGTLVDASIFREWIANVGRRDARTRVAHLLCELALRLKVAGLGQQTNYDVPLTQEQLADATGMTSVHVNRTIKALERDGLIDRIHPRQSPLAIGKSSPTPATSTAIICTLGKPSLLWREPVRQGW